MPLRITGRIERHLTSPKQLTSNQKFRAETSKIEFLQQAARTKATEPAGRRRYETGAAVRREGLPLNLRNLLVQYFRASLVLPIWFFRSIRPNGNHAYSCQSETRRK